MKSFELRYYHVLRLAELYNISMWADLQMHFPSIKTSYVEWYTVNLEDYSRILELIGDTTPEGMRYRNVVGRIL